jgi:hypothetical protein
VKTYIYPQNLKARAHLWFWSLRDFLILSISCLASAVIFVQAGIILPSALSLCFGFLTIRLEETTVMDYLSLAVRYFLTTQQYYEWR